MTIFKTVLLQLVYIAGVTLETSWHGTQFLSTLLATCIAHILCHVGFCFILSCILKG